jgi:hypothetical protein
MALRGRAAARHGPGLSLPDGKKGAGANSRDLLSRRFGFLGHRKPAKHVLCVDQAGSVREQDRHAHVLEHVAGDAAQHHLTQARVTVAAHDEEIGFLLVGLRQE